MRTDYTGAVAAGYASAPFGDPETPSILQPAGGQDAMQFADLDQDSDSSGAAMSEHAQFRNYSFNQGRWLAPDSYTGSTTSPTRSHSIAMPMS